MKKVISLFLSIAMLLSIVSVVDFSAYASVETGKCGDNVTYSLDTSTGVLTISGTGNIYYDCQVSIKNENDAPYLGDYLNSVSSRSPFFSKKEITSVIINPGITSISGGVFTFCTNLTSVTIPDTVTYIGKAVFAGCNLLESISMPDSVTFIGKCAFGDCYNLLNINIPKSVTNIGEYAFLGCINLKNVTISKNVVDTYISEYSFANCYNLTNIAIPNSVTKIGDSAFKNCSSLTDVTIPNSVTSIGDYAFKGCTSLTNITIPDSVTSIGDFVFLNCTSLASITIPNSVTSIGRSAFNNCSSLTDVTIPDSVTRIDSSAFYECHSMTYITIPDSVVSIGDSAFKYCTRLTGVKIGSNIKTIPSDAFYCTALKSVIIPNNVTRIGSGAFCYCESMKDLIISEGVKFIDYSAFEYCTSIASVTIPNSVTNIGSNVFYGSNLKSVNYNGTISQWKSINGYSNIPKAIICTDGITGNGSVVTIDSLKYKLGDNKASVIGYTGAIRDLMIPGTTSYEGYKFNVTSISDNAFSDCTSLTSITIPNSVTSIGSGTFSNCTNLKSVTIPNSVTSIGSSAFSGCTSLTSVTIPDSVTSIGHSAFYNCTGLTSVTIPNSVTSIGQEAFFNCSNLKSVNYNGTKAQWKSISGYGNVSQIIKCTDGIYANSNTIIVDSVKYRLNDDYTAQVISYSGAPENITILESVTYEGFTFKVTSIGESAFKGCTSLTNITIPDSVTTIGNNAFNGCSKLKKIEIPDSVTYIGSKAFDGTAFYNTVKNWEDGVLYCGNHLISAKSDVTKITVKASTVSIATGALDNCKSLKKINVLNPKCVINCTIPKTAVIGGAEGSTAEDFAQKNNMSIDYFEECTHSDKVQVVIAATCTEQGAVQSRCADCDKLISQTFTAPLGHTMVITTPAKAPTCTTSGNTQAGYCTVCGYNEVSTVIPATGHNFGNNSANCLVCGVANPNYVAPTQPNQNETNTSNDEDVTVTSKPKSASIKKAKGKNKAIELTWCKVASVSGYEIQVATDKKFKKNKKTVTIKKQKTTKTTVKKLKAKKKYYVRVRTYKIVNGKKVYSSWSKVKSVKTK